MIPAWPAFALLLLVLPAQGGQNYVELPNGWTETWTDPTLFGPTVVTDSVVWRSTVDSLNPGIPDSLSVCEVLVTGHEWIYSEGHRAGGDTYCSVLHFGHCSYNDQVRERICRRCRRHEFQREQWYQRNPDPPSSAFDSLATQLRR